MSEAQPIVFNDLDSLRAAVGTTFGPTEWLTIAQERINQFADATGDHQWIHIDRERAKNGPFGTTIAHGYLTLSLVSLFLPMMVSIQGISMGINYGLDKVRFPSPVAENSRVRATGELTDASDIPGGVQTVIRVTIEIEGNHKPACVAEVLARWMA